MDRHIYWIWLRQALQGNVKMMYALYSVIADVEQIFRADRHQYKAWGIPDTYIKDLSDKDLTAAYNILGQCHHFDIEVVSIEDELYPASLRDIALPPCLLFYQGNLKKCLDSPILTLIGTRYSTATGEAIASDFAYELSSAGFTVCCGVAEGIEAAVQQSVLRADGRCLLLLPCGMLVVNKRVKYLIKDVVVNGAVISEWLPHERVERDSYHIRNRLLGALSDGVLALQTPKKSGVLMTVNYALQQGRDVFSIPGGLRDPSYAGNNQLLREGAIPAIESADIIGFYKPKWKEALCSLSEQDPQFERFVQSVSQKTSFDSEMEQLIYSVLDNEGQTVDEIVMKTDLHPQQVLCQLSLMEVKGWICSIPGGKYKLNS